MNFSDVIKMGDKIDIHLSEKDMWNSHEGIAQKLYKSSVYDVVSDEAVQITMPMDGTRIILFDAGMSFSMIFYTKKGLYSGEGVVQNRFKEGSNYVLTVLAKSPLKKFQRREFFRINKMIDLDYFHISDEVAALPTTEELFVITHNPDNHYEKYNATILDISGGGIRFTTTEQLETDSYILSVFELMNDRYDNKFYLVTQIIESTPVKGNSEHFMNRAKFVLKNLKDREAIVRYIFEEERQMRKKEIG
ncbi:MAG: flagellar brake domain-containing protein [Agathobacter sp.]|nr:flagellar brake domain-containing protein [Agathobacter sp.]MBQ2282603.1 flagellar brake domain-containing protein [Agathobacter sp.]